jgi:hypothetical protein
MSKHSHQRGDSTLCVAWKNLNIFGIKDNRAKIDGAILRENKAFAYFR